MVVSGGDKPRKGRLKGGRRDTKRRRRGDGAKTGNPASTAKHCLEVAVTGRGHARGRRIEAWEFFAALSWDLGGRASATGATSQAVEEGRRSVGSSTSHEASSRQQEETEEEEGHIQPCKRKRFHRRGRRDEETSRLQLRVGHGRAD